LAGEADSGTAQPQRAGPALAEAEVLEWVAKSYLGMTARDLSDDVMYQTAPMKKKLKMGERLPMDEINRTDEAFEDADRLIRSLPESRRPEAVDGVDQALLKLAANPLLSGAEALLIASRGRMTSMSFLGATVTLRTPPGSAAQMPDRSRARRASSRH
jgi:hypothetical protein